MEVSQYRGRLQQRRALICRSKMNAKWIDPIIIWVDDDDRCKFFPMSHKDSDGRPVNPLWHAYQLDTGLYAVRCPGSIGDDEKWRVIVDIPIGSAMLKFKSFLSEHGKHSSVSGGPKSDDDAEGSWSNLVIAAMSLFLL